VLSGLAILGILGTIYTFIVFIVSILKFNNIEQQFLRKFGPSFAFSIVTMIIVALLSDNINFFMFLVISEFLLMLTLFYNYLRANVYFLSVLVFTTYFEDILVILSVYFSLYLTGSIFQSKSQEGKGSFFVVSSYLLMDIALLLQAFYILGLNKVMFNLGVSLFVISIVLFLFPFLSGGTRINAKK
jgi:hypothetical protein